MVHFIAILYRFQLGKLVMNPYFNFYILLFKLNFVCAFLAFLVQLLGPQVDNVFFFNDLEVTYLITNFKLNNLLSIKSVKKGQNT